MKISIAGELGSGKSTVSKILIERLGAEYYYTGAIMRAVAESRGMSVVELSLYMESHPEIDHEIDDGLRRLSDDPREMIIDSRLAWHFVRDTYKVYLTVDPLSAANRIFRDNRATESADSVEAVLANIKTRRESEKKRYREQYGVDCKDLSNYDLVIDTTHASPEAIAELILNGKAAHEADRAAGGGFYVCPLRLRFPDDASDEQKVARYASALDEGIAPDEAVEIVDYDGDFYVVGGVEAALAYTMCDHTFVPCVYRGEREPEGKFVTMSDTLF